ncbi:hypothetical protein J8273_1002 [Carpediemonas membranifera]|uniref:CAAX prenyl protease 2/Lysostaphin resistance protein A-like domain-containing protein n=1 Tax=Carpediemonas membranifera TaxID=201153 RepID=A0A8J6BB70_9EUKA|nr:hypothetical protein J8273_1002 [Carpediemonas membranifera]|eukprot:KAG9397094.1 hypothetical protein J8273_1002 [Carpediemonas membranifera]
MSVKDIVVAALSSLLYTSVIDLILFLIVLIILLSDALLANPTRRLAAHSGYERFTLGEQPSFLQQIWKCVRSSALLVSIVAFELIVAGLRRAIMGVDLTLAALIAHCVASVLDIVWIFILVRFVSKATLTDLGLPRQIHGWTSPRMWGARFIIAGSIVFVTYAAMLLFYYVSDCMSNYTYMDFSSKGVVYTISYFAAQVLTLVLGAIDEETGTRGLVHSIWLRADHAKWLMPLVSGILYAAQHALNSAHFIRGNFSDIIGILLMIGNYVMQGVIYMLLFITTEDIIGNYVLHFMSEQVELWFGAAAMEAYSVPFGQLAPFAIDCNVKPINAFVGHKFGITGSAVYSVALMYSMLVVMLVLWGRRRKEQKRRPAQEQ